MQAVLVKLLADRRPAGRLYKIGDLYMGDKINKVVLTIRALDTSIMIKWLRISTAAGGLLCGGCGTGGRTKRIETKSPEDRGFKKII